MDTDVVQLYWAHCHTRAAIWFVPIELESRIDDNDPLLVRCPKPR